MDFEHKRFGKCVLGDLNQKQLEDFHRAMKGKENEPLSVWRGDSVREAARLGLIITPALTPEAVDGLKPGNVIWLADCIAKLFTEAMKPLDPLS